MTHLNERDVGVWRKTEKGHKPEQGKDNCLKTQVTLLL